MSPTHRVGKPRDAASAEVIGRVSTPVTLPTIPVRRGRDIIRLGAKLGGVDASLRSTPPSSVRGLARSA
jgi:hypothetical protein